MSGPRHGQKADEAERLPLDQTAASGTSDAAEEFVAALTDEERGRLATALLIARGDENEQATWLAQLRLDSADPSLMSRADVAILLADLGRRDPAAARRATRALAHNRPADGILGAIFAPSRGTSDTSTLGGDPTADAEARP